MTDQHTARREADTRADDKVPAIRIARGAL